MLKVVLADDENKILLLLQKLIDWKELGYEIVGTANDGLRALELVREKRPHLLITDVRMPGCSGIELIQRAKDQDSKAGVAPGDWEWGAERGQGTVKSWL